MTAYYNEWDKPAAAWLRELIKQGLIADGVVDERSIIDVEAADVKNFKRMHDGGINNWSDIEWIYCRDGKHRPILTGLKPVLPTKPRVKPLADGLPRGMVYSGDHSTQINQNEIQEARVMRLRGYGNSIVPQVAAEFISAFMEVCHD
jgi:hypothetical protein